MHAPHAIQTLRFELRADAVPQARRLPERFSALCRQQLAVVLEDEFAAHCPPHQQLHLPQLVLELPPIADRRLEAELPDLVRRALRAALSQLSASEKTPITSTPEATSWLDVLEHFLRHGRLPWQVAAGSFSLDEVLRSVVEHQAAAFRVLLVRLGQTAQRRQRLVWQLNADQLQLLLAVLEPIHAPFLHAYVLATLAAHRRQPLTPVTATALRSVIYELVLADLLLHAGTAFNRRAFLERQVRQLAAQYNLVFAELLQQLVAAELALTPRTQSALSVLLEDLHQRYYLPITAPGATDAAAATGQWPNPSRVVGGTNSQAIAYKQQAIGGASSASSPRENSIGATAAAAAIVARAAAGTAVGAAAGTTSSAATAATAADSVAADFSANPAAALTYFLQYGSLPLAAPARTPQQLLAGFPAWLTQGWRVLRPALQAGGLAALHRLAYLLPESMLMQVLRLAAPGHLRPVQGVMEAVGQQPATRVTSNTRPQLWFHTFKYLLQEDFRTFSSPKFQQWLVQQLAASAAGIPSDFSQPAVAAVSALSLGKASTTSDTPLVGDHLFVGSTSVAGPASAASNSTSDSNVFSDIQSSVARRVPVTGELAPAAHSASAASAAGAGAILAEGTGLAAHNTPGVGRLFAGSSAAATGHALATDGAPDSADARAVTAATAAGHAPAAGSALTLLQAQQVIQSHLAGGVMPPWWPGGTASPTRLRALLAQVLRERRLPDFLRTQLLTATAQQRLAALADFSQLAGLLAARRLSSGSTTLITALAALERRETTGAPGQPSNWLQLLRAAYLAFYLRRGQQAAAGSILSDIQRLTTVYQLPMSATLGKIRRLLAAGPNLLADTFFSSLNQSLLLPVSTRATHPAEKPKATEAAPVVGKLNPVAAPATQVAESGFSDKQSTYLEEQSSQPRRRSGLQNEYGRPSEEQRDSSPYSPTVTERLTQIPTGVAARDLVFYLLRHQQVPWWAPAGLTVAHQRQLLTQVAQQYRPGLQALVQAHGRELVFRQALAELASFAQLARFVSKPGQAAPGRLAPAVLTALDQQLARTGEPVARLLRQAFLTATFHPNPTDIRTLAAEVRVQAMRAGTAWRTVLRYVAWLHRQLPALATAPFFAALLAAAVTHEQGANTHRRTGRQTRTQQHPTGPAQSLPAATAFQELEQYLRTGQTPALTVGKNVNGIPTGNALANGTAAPRAVANGQLGAGNTALNSPAAASRSATAGTATHLFPTHWKLLLRPEHRFTVQPLRPLLASRTVRARLLAGLAETEFWQLLRQLYPSHHRLAFRIAADWQLLARQGLVKLSAPAFFEVLLALIQSTPVASWRPETAVQALLAAEDALWPQTTAKRGHSRAGQLLAAIGRRGLVLRGPLGALLTVHHQGSQVAKPTPPSTPIPFINEEDRPMETVYLANAGLVLLWPFLTMLFDRLGYLENQQFRDEANRQRAALLLQFLASGASEVPEYQLPLNKLLCGMPQGQPLPRELALTDAETELGESLLKAVIARWEILKNTSIAGLRETFLLRAGKLEWLPDDRIVLTVEPKTLDILLDQRPWSISIIKLPWMAAPLYVTWR